MDDTYSHHGRRTEGGTSGSQVLGGIPTIRGMSKDDNMSPAARLKAMMQQDALEAVEPDADLEDGDGDIAFAGVFGAGTKKFEESVTAEPALAADTVDMAPMDWSAQVEGVQRVLGMEVGRRGQRFVRSRENLISHLVLDSLQPICLFSSTCCGWNTCIASGAVPNTPALKRWTDPVDVQGKTKMITRWSRSMMM